MSEKTNFVKVPLSLMYKLGRIDRRARKVLKEHLIKNEMVAEVSGPVDFKHNETVEKEKKAKAEAEALEKKKAEEEAEAKLDAETPEPIPEPPEPIPAPTSDDMFELGEETLTEEELRARAQEAGVKNWHIKKPETLIEELSSEGII